MALGRVFRAIDGIETDVRWDDWRHDRNVVYRLAPLVNTLGDRRRHATIVRSASCSKNFYRGLRLPWSEIAKGRPFVGNCVPEDFTAVDRRVEVAMFQAYF
jgi:hypothetical protein